MRPLAIAAVLSCASLSGCAGAALVALSTGQAEALVTNFENAMECQQYLTEYAFAAARGDVNISGFTYDAPAPANNFVGTLSAIGGSFPFGTGDFTMTFTVAGDGGVFVDPYGPGVDLSQHSQVVADVDVLFSGLSPVGQALTAAADLVITTTANNTDNATTVIDGTYDVDHDGYDVDLAAAGLGMAFDLAARTVESVTGSVTGTVDIPDFAADVDVALEGLGTSIQVSLDVAVTSIEYVLSLF